MARLTRCFSAVWSFSFFYWRIWESHLEFEYFTSAGRVAPLLFPGYTPLLSEYLKERLWPMPGTALIPGLHPAALRVFKAEPLVQPQFRGRVKHADQQSHADAVEQQQARGSRRLYWRWKRTSRSVCCSRPSLLRWVVFVCLIWLIDLFVLMYLLTIYLQSERKQYQRATMFWNDHLTILYCD